jgi:hypothetical protein
MRHPPLLAVEALLRTYQQLAVLCGKDGEGVLRALGRARRLLKLPGFRDLEAGNPIHAGDQIGIHEKAVESADRGSWLPRHVASKRVQARLLPGADQVELGRLEQRPERTLKFGDGDAAIRNRVRPSKR